MRLHGGGECGWVEKCFSFVCPPPTIRCIQIIEKRGTVWYRVSPLYKLEPVNLDRLKVEWLTMVPRS